MKIFLDDRRPCPSEGGWVLCRWPAEVIALLQAQPNEVERVSLDHDLGDADQAKAEGRREITGYDVVLWVEEQVHTNPNYVPPTLIVHSDNGPGIDRMRQGILSISRRIARRIAHREDY